MRRGKKQCCCWKELRSPQHLPEWNKEFAKKLKNVESRSKNFVDLEHQEVCKEMLRGTTKSDLCIVSMCHAFECFWQFGRLVHTESWSLFMAMDRADLGVHLQSMGLGPKGY